MGPCQELNPPQRRAEESREQQRGGWDGEEEEDEEEKVTEGRERYSKQLTLQQWTHTLKSNAYPLFSQTRS